LSATVQQFEYKTEILTSMVGREKVRLGDLDDTLQRHGAEGWELVSVNLDASLRGTQDGHLLIFKRPVGVASATEVDEAEREAAAEAGDPWSQGWADAARAASEEE
jgi:hypothetical protein